MTTAAGGARGHHPPVERPRRRRGLARRSEGRGALAAAGIELVRLQRHLLAWTGRFPDSTKGSRPEGTVLDALAGGGQLGANPSPWWDLEPEPGGFNPAHLLAVYDLGSCASSSGRAAAC